MKIETRYNIGDKVWFMFDNKVTMGIIDAIKTYTCNDMTHESYNTSVDFDKTANNIQKAFSTKEELLQSL